MIRKKKNTQKKQILLRKNHAEHLSICCLWHNEPLSKPALRGKHPVFRGDGLSSSIEASVAMHGVFLYTVFFNGFLAALGQEKALSLSLSPSSFPPRNLSLSLPSSSLANLRAFFPPRLLFSARPSRSLLLSSPPLPLPACYFGIAVFCSPFPRVSRKAKWSFCSAFTAGARGREAYNFLGVFIAG